MYGAFVSINFERSLFRSRARHLIEFGFPNLTCRNCLVDYLSKTGNICCEVNVRIYSKRQIHNPASAISGTFFYNNNPNMSTILSLAGLSFSFLLNQENLFYRSYQAIINLYKTLSILY